MKFHLKIAGFSAVAALLLLTAGCGDAAQDPQQDNGAAESEVALNVEPPSAPPELIVDEEPALIQPGAPVSTPDDAVLLDASPLDDAPFPDQDTTVQAPHDHDHEPTNGEAAAYNPNAPVARVGDEIITGKEFQREMHMVWQRMELEAGRHVDPPPSFRLDVLNALINARVMRILARNEDIEVNDAEVEQEFQLRKRLFSSETEYAQYLEATGLTEAELLENIRHRLMVEKYQDSLIEGVEPPEELIEAEYEQMAAAGQLQRVTPTVDVAHILIRVPDVEDEAAWEQALTRIEAARERIEGGESFEEVAREVSEDYLSADRGGLYPESTRGRVPEAIEEVMFNLEPGALSEPLRGQAGWHLIQVIHRNEPGLIAFDDARDFVAAYLLDNLQRERMEEKVNQAKLVMDIEVYDARADDVPLEHHHH